MNPPTDERAVGPDAPATTVAQMTAPMADMAAALDAMLALDGLERFATAKTLPAAFFTHFAAALAAYDAEIAAVLAAAPGRVTCQAGCSACCRHELARGVTLVEIVAIYRHVRPWADIGAIYDAAGENAVTFQRLLAAELRKTGAPLEPNDPRIYTAHIAYNRLRRPCPFLDQAQGTCRIYPVRPLVCRWFHNRSPAAWCEPDHPQYLDRDAVGIYPHPAINDRLRALGERLGITTVNYLAGAFVHIGGDVLGGAPIRERPG